MNQSDTPRTDAHMDFRRKTYGPSASGPTPEFCFALEREAALLSMQVKELRKALFKASDYFEVNGYSYTTPVWVVIKEALEK